MASIPMPPEQDEDEARDLALARETDSCRGKTRCTKRVCFWPQCGGGPDLMYYSSNIKKPRR